MNVRYTTLSIVALAFIGGAMAQNATPRYAKKDFRPATETQITPRAPQEANATRGSGVIFSEDFANGLDGNNGGVGAWSIEGPNGNIWKRSTTGPNGAYSTVAQKIASTTAANGFMIFASDSANTNWSANPPAIVANPVNWEASMVSPLLDLSANPFVEIEFQQRIRYCCGGEAPSFLEVSTDGGITWPEEFSYSTAVGIATNVDPGTQTRKINLVAAVAANPAQVKLRFRHSATGESSHYYWQLDDVKIQELQDYDLRMSAAANTAYDYFNTTTYDSVNYSIYPYSQLRPMTLTMTVLNNGSSTLDDVTANFTVTNGATTVLNQDQAVPSFPAGEERYISVDPSFTPPAVAGTYNVAYSITSGQPDPIADNTATSTFKVSPNYYALDAGGATGYENGNGDGGVLIVGNVYYAYSAADLYSIAVVLGAQSVVGDLIVGEIREAYGDRPVLASTEELVVTAAMLNGTGGSAFTQLIFDTPYTLEAGMDYLVTVQVYGNVRIGEGGSAAPGTSFIYYVSPTQGENWFYTTTPYMVRMNFDATVGIEENDYSNGVGLGQNFPNPSNGSTTIPYELQTAANVNFEVRDLAGKLVYSQNEGQRGAGVYRCVLNTEGLSEGMYNYTILAGEVRQTKSMSIVK